MTLHDLTEQLSPNFPPSVQKDLKTAIRALAQALKYADAKSCPLEACLQPLPNLYQIIETFLTSQGKGPHTIRNTKNNLSRLFRLAESQHMFTLLPAKLHRRFKSKLRPPRHGGARLVQPDGSHLLRRNWPAEVEAEFATFAKWATDPLVPGRDARWKKRQVTIQTYQRTFETYFGYLHHVLKISPVEFNHLFNFSLIEKFVYWQINDKFHRVTITVNNIITFMQAIASQYRIDPSLKESLKILKKHLPSRQPFYNKNDGWIPLREIERIGLALWPSKPREAISKDGVCPESHGCRYAAGATISLMLRLWVHIPYRQRNMREMKLGENLYRTPDSQWRIRFAGEQLKISKKRGKINVFDLPFPPTLVPTLESYLSTWRPILIRETNISEVFPNYHGRAFTGITLRNNVTRQVYNFTGKHWHPHMIRTTWATEWIQSSSDFMTAAIMLNDTLETVIQNYSHLREENVAEKAYQWVQSRADGH